MVGSKVNSFLSHLNLSTSDKDINSLIDKIKSWKELPYAERRNVVDAINKSEIEVELFNSKIKPHTKCPATHTPVVSSCSISNCRYFVQYPWSYNCTLSFLAEHDKESLSEEEISFLHKIPLGLVKDTVKKSMSKIRKKMVYDSLVDDRHPRFEFIPGFCVSCQCVIDECEEDLQINDKFGYCDPKCKEDLTPVIWKIEKEFGMSFKDVFYKAAKMFPSVSALEEIFDLPKGSLRKALRRNSKAIKLLDKIQVA